MKRLEQVPAVMVLEDGKVFYGKSSGKVGTTTGELCFNTGMTGYQEVFTDPSYFGQLLIMTNDHIGNYGVYTDDAQSDGIKIAGLITKNYTHNYSRQRATGSIQDYLEDAGVVGICDVDTRAIVRYIRDKGAMNAIISSEISDIEILKEQLSKVPSMEGLELASKVSTKEPYFLGDKNAQYRVAVLDLGVKKNILNCLVERNCYLQVFPAHTTAQEIKASGADGYFISNGPGDPASMNYAVDTVRTLQTEKLPIFGICLGHQIIALANGVSTYKMHNGHRGLNHPVKNIITGQCEITSQNHGFEVDSKAIERTDKVEVTHVNLNDNTIEGIRIKGEKVFSVQYHPESAPGPHDSRYLFDYFISMMSE